LVWIANVYMGIYGRIRLDLQRERAEITVEEGVVAANKALEPQKVMDATPSIQR